MKFFLLIGLIVSCRCFGHPGIGIVKDSKGFIYYTDLEKVWKVDPSTLKKTVVVPNVHTHELLLDKDDNLFGQDLQYSGEATNIWHHSVWKLSPTGKIDTVIPETEGVYLEQFTLVADEQGNQYWNQHWKTDKIIKRKPTGETEVLAEGDFKDVQWMFALNGNLYFIKNGNVYVIAEPGKLKFFAGNVNQQKPGGAYSIWGDNHKNIYISNTDVREVQKVTVTGKISSYFKFEKDWLITAGLFDNNENLWLLECSVKNEIRVRKVEKNRIGYSFTNEENAVPKNVTTILTAAIIIGTSIYFIGRKK